MGLQHLRPHQRTTHRVTKSPDHWSGLFLFGVGLLSSAATVYFVHRYKERLTMPQSKTATTTSFHDALAKKDVRRAYELFGALGRGEVFSTLTATEVTRLLELPRSVETFFIALEQEDILEALVILDDLTDHEICEIFSQHDMVAGLFDVPLRHTISYEWGRVAALVAMSRGLSMDDITTQIVLNQPGGLERLHQLQALLDQ